MTLEALRAGGNPRGSAQSTREELTACGFRYQLTALLTALERMGFSSNDIRFDSRDPDEIGAEGSAGRVRLGPAGALVRGVRFERERGVTVYLNVGLFSAVSPLPSYFHQLIEDREVGEGMTTLLRVLDDGALRSLACAEAFKPSREVVWARRFSEARVSGTPLYVEGLFRQVFPELRVRVEWRAVRRRLRVERVALSSSTLGSCAFGGYGQLIERGLEVTLTVPWEDGEGVLAASGEQDEGLLWRTWAEEARHRLDMYVLPRFARNSTAFVVRLRILGERDQARLAGARLGENSLPTAPRPFTMVLYEGSSARTAGEL